MAQEYSTNSFHQDRVSDVELHALDQTRNHPFIQDAQDGAPEDGGSSLPPVDTGKDAWLFLAGCFVTEIFVWGFPFSYGIFQSYYSTHEPFAGDSRIATIGTTCTGLMYLDVPLVLAMAVFVPSWRPFLQLVALVLMCAGLLGSSFATNVSQLIATQGVLFAIGGSIMYCWVFLYLNEWFVKRKGLAYGIAWSATGFAGVVVPPLLQALLDRFGQQVALRAWAITMFVFLAPASHFIKPRLPPSRTQRIDLTFLISPAFMLIQLGNIVQGLGYFLPAIYLPTYATLLGGSHATAAATLIALNLAMTAGSIGIGALADRLHATTCLTFCEVASALVVFLLWGLSSKLPLLFLFAVGYGLTAGSSSAAWSGVMRLVSQKTARAEPTMVLAFLASGRGIGNIISGPVSEALLRGKIGPEPGTIGYRSSFGPLIIFTGVTAFCGGLTILGRVKPGLL